MSRARVPSQPAPELVPLPPRKRDTAQDIQSWIQRQHPDMTVPPSAPVKKQKLEKKENGADLLQAIADVRAARQNVPSFVALSAEAKHAVLSQQSKLGQADAAISRNIRGTIAALQTSRSEHARFFRLSVGAALLNHTPGLASGLSNYQLGQHVGLHGQTVKKIESIVSADLSDVASRVLTSKRARRTDRLDFDESDLKVLALDWLISTTRDSADPDDQILVRIHDRKLYVACRYLNVNKGEAYFNFIRDISRVWQGENPTLSLRDHTFVGKTIFLKWLREWTFIKAEEWYVCICSLCFNMDQYVKAYAKLVRRIHGQTASLDVLPKVPTRLKLHSDEVQCDTDQESDGEERDLDSNHPAECKTAEECMSAPFRKRTTAQVPVGNNLHTYAPSVLSVPCS